MNATQSVQLLNIDVDEDSDSLADHLLDSTLNVKEIEDGKLFQDVLESHVIICFILYFELKSFF